MRERELGVFLLDKGANLDAGAFRGVQNTAGEYIVHKGTRSLHVAIANGHLDVVRALYRAGADVNASRVNGVTPLMAACMKGATARRWVLMARELLEAGANPALVSEKGGYTALHLAVLYGEIGVISLLVSKGPAILSRPTSLGCTPLYLAAANGKENATLYLLATGAKEPSVSLPTWDVGGALGIAIVPPQGCTYSARQWTGRSEGTIRSWPCS